MAYYLFWLLLIGLPVILVGAAVLMTADFLHGGAQQRRTGIIYLFSALGFALLDALLLKALPWLGLSFGPAWFSLATFLLARTVFYVLWAGVQVRLLRSARKSDARRDARVLLYAFWGINAVFTLLIVYGFYVEPFQIHTSRIEVPVPVEKLSRPVRIVQLSDLHVERTTIREKSLAPLVNSLEPDLIVLTGDYLNLSYLHDPTAMQHARDFLAQISAPHGVYAVNGSVDNAERMANLFSGSAITVLNDEIVQVTLPGGKLALVGVSNWDSAHDGEMVRALPGRVSDGLYRLMLFHTPDQVEEAAKGGVDLYLAGHTHGGQIRMPFYGAVITSSRFHKKYEAGRYQVGNTTLYVSRGIGMEGSIAPRARFLSPPEVVVIDLVPGASASAPANNAP